MAWDARCLWHWYDPDSFFEIAEESSGFGYCAVQRQKMTILTTWISHLFYFNVWYDWMFSSPSHLVIIFAHWQGAPSCWKRHSSSPARSWMTGRSCAHRTFWQRSPLMGNFESEPTPQAEKQTHTCVVSGCFGVAFPTHRWSWGSPVLAQTGFFSDASNNRTGDLSKKMTLPQSSAAQSLYLLQNISPSFVFFFVAAQCANGFTHAWCLSWASPAIPRYYFLCHPEAFFTTIKPLSLKFPVIWWMADLVAAAVLEAIFKRPFLCKAMTTAQIL